MFEVCPNCGYKAPLPKEDNRPYVYQPYPIMKWSKERREFVTINTKAIWDEEIQSDYLEVDEYLKLKKVHKNDQAILEFLNKPKLLKKRK